MSERELKAIYHRETGHYAPDKVDSKDHEYVVWLEEKVINLYDEIYKTK